MKHLLLLHGALATSSQMQELQERLSSDFDVSSINFTGHGIEKLTTSGFSFDHFVGDIKSHIRYRELKELICFGYSMGGYAALLSSLSEPAISQVITLGTKFNWNPEEAARETKMLNVEKIKEKVPSFAGVLAERHGEQYWESVVNSTSRLLEQLGNSPLLSKEKLSSIQVPVNCLVGDEDAVAGVIQTRQWAAWIPHGKVEVLTSTPHIFEKVDLAILVKAIENCVVR